MTCTPNHLLIELGVSRRKEGREIMEQPSHREQHLQADADSARQQSYNMTVEARQEKAKADRLRAVNAKLVEALEALLKDHCSLVNSGDCGFWEVEEEDEVIRAREAIEEA